MDNAESTLREVRTILRQLLRVIDSALTDEQTKNEERMKKHLEAQGISVTDDAVPEPHLDDFEI